MNDSDRLRQEADEAERVYNDALTALDHAFIPVDETPGPVPPWPDAVLPPPAGPHKPWLRIVHRWLAPVFARQRTFDNHVVDAIDALTDQEREVAFARFETALIIFLQKITAFVESKDRLLAATAAARLDRHDELLGQLPGNADAARRPPARDADAHADRRHCSRQWAVGSRQSAVRSRRPVSPANPSNLSIPDYQYVAFEDRFRGSDDEIREKLRAYVPLFAGAPTCSISAAGAVSFSRCSRLPA